MFSPDGARILTASWDKTARLWDGGSGKLLATFQHEGAVNSAVFSPDGARILTASADRTARLWDGGSGKLLATFQHESEVRVRGVQSRRDADPDGERGQNRAALGWGLREAAGHLPA